MATRATDIYAETLAVFADADRPHEPRTTPEVADALDCGRRAVYKRLDELASRGELQTKKVGAGARVWWKPPEPQGERAESLQRYRRVVDALGDPVYELDASGRFTYVNEAAVELSGYDEAELLGESVTLGMTDESIEQISTTIGELLANDTTDSFTVEYEAETKTGERIPVENHIAILRDEDGRFTGSTGVVRDISERKAREAEIERTQTLLRNAERMGKVGGWELDVETGSITWTEGARRIHGTDDEFEPTLDGALDFFHPDDHDTITGFVERCIETGESYGEDLRMITATGEERWVRAAGEALVTDGETHTLRGYIQDITERIEREQALQRTTDLLEHAEQLANVGGWELDVSEQPYEAVWTDGFFEIFETEPRESMTPDDVLEFVHPEDRARVERETETYLEEQRGMETEYRIVTDEGTVKWVRTFSEPSEACEDVISGATLDITDQKTRERDLERQRSDLEALNGLHETVSRITEAAIDQSTRGEIEQVACEQLAAAESYSFAWVAEVDPKTGSLTSRVESGADGYFDRARLATNPSFRRGRGPTGRAIETQEIQASRNVFEDPSFEPWRELANEYGYSSAAAIPMVHEGTLYGLVGLYSDRTDAFGETERRVVGQLGEILGHAIASVERKRALLSDDVVDIRLRTRSVVDCDRPDGRVDCSVTFDRTIPLDAGSFLVYGRVDEGAAEVLQRLVAAPEAPHWASVSVVGSDDENTRFQARLVDPPILGPVAAHGGQIRTLTFEHGTLSVALRLPAEADTQGVVDEITAVDPDVELLAHRQTTATTDDGVTTDNALSQRLTDRQRAALEASYFAGYFDWPRGSSGQDVASSLDISSSTFHQHIRRAQKKLLDDILRER